MEAGDAGDIGPRPAESDLSLILYTSGTTGRPKGVPRTQRNHYAGAVAQALQCGYAWGERTLGVMPLYHTMGIHALTGMVAVNGCFVCQPEWDARAALTLIQRERITSLYLIPTLFYDLVHAPELTREAVESVTRLAYAGAPMLAPLTEACVKAFSPPVFVNHYGSTEIYTFSIRPDVHLKPGCAGRPGLHSSLRVVTASTERRVGPDEIVAPDERGEIIASLDSDEAFAGYWRRPDADAKALRDGWYFTGDMGYVDADGELFVSGRVDDMIISGGENIHPVEVEDVLARHPPCAMSRWWASPTRAGGSAWSPSSCRRRPASRSRRSTPTAGPAPTSPASSGRDASSWSARFPRPRPAKSCAACSATASTRRSRHERVPASGAGGHGGHALDRPPAQDEHDDGGDAQRVPRHLPGISRPTTRCASS